MCSRMMKRFDGVLPVESFAIVKEVAGRMGTTILSFVSMAAIKYAMDKKREFENTTYSRSTSPSPEGSEHFTKLMNEAEKNFAKRIPCHLDVNFALL